MLIKLCRCLLRIIVELHIESHAAHVRGTILSTSVCFQHRFLCHLLWMTCASYNVQAMNKHDWDMVMIVVMAIR